MLSSGLVAFLFAIGVAGWTYSKMDRRMGGANSHSVLWMTALAFVVAFLVLFTAFKYLINFGG